ncbi:hypothetical protein INT46_008875 [Mucor plumbeus]|uniref:Uncharacterized protein n=1 Tax=Mucor plumbeus TaxID=97098 RepID=A0A8H7RAA0_9FUNG|nr:hypothetical protein INT46_008875 [Mucor plumbeus]
MESFENIQETLNVAEASLAKLTIQDKCPRTLQDEMSITHELKQLRLSHNSQPKQIKMALQDYKQYESKAPIRKLKLRRFIVNDPKRQLKRVQTINELEKYVSEYKCNQKVVNDNLTGYREVRL